jgi:hypothetical protein
MVGFLQDYGLWIALAGVFLAMQWFGMGCCGGHRSRRESESPKPSSEGKAAAGSTGDAVPKSQGRCH